MERRRKTQICSHGRVERVVGCELVEGPRDSGDICKVRTLHSKYKCGGLGCVAVPFPELPPCVAPGSCRKEKLTSALEGGRGAAAIIPQRPSGQMGEMDELGGGVFPVACALPNSGPAWGAAQ